MSGYVLLANHQNTPADNRRAKELRQLATLPEQIMWHELRMATKTRNFRFRRQHPLHGYIVDFICLKLKLLIEIDGESHDMRQKHDQIRDQVLRQNGFNIMRFTNADVRDNREGVILTILNCAESLQKARDVPHP